MNGLYHIVVVALALVGLIRGWRSGFVWQIASILGMAFGVVAANVFNSQAQEFLLKLFPSMGNGIAGGFITSVLAGGSIYIGVMVLFRLLAGVFRGAMQVLELGALNSIFGSAFGALKYMVALSIFYNLIVCVDPSSSLMRYSTHDDGNLVQGVMMLAPALLGSEDIADLAHRIQLDEAKKISSILPENINQSSPQDCCLIYRQIKA